MLEFAEGAIQEERGDGFGAEEHAVDVLLAKAGACEVFAHKVV